MVSSLSFGSLLLRVQTLVHCSWSVPDRCRHFGNEIAKDHAVRCYFASRQRYEDQKWKSVMPEVAVKKEVLKQEVKAGPKTQCRSWHKTSRTDRTSNLSAEDGRMQKRTDSSRKEENWKFSLPCTRPVNVYVLHMDRIISHRSVTWSIVPSSSNAPQDTFLGSVIEGRGELVLFGGVRYMADSRPPSFRFFFEQTHGAAVGTVFVLKPSLEEHLTVVPDLIKSAFVAYSGNMGTVKPICAVSEEARSQINQFRNKRCSGTCALILKIHQATHQLEPEEQLENVSIEQLRDSLPDIVPRFVLLCRRLVHSDERVSFPLLVIFFSPYGCTPTMQMLYAGSLNLVLCESRINRYMEIRELEELTDSSIDESLNLI
ncbi:hypothetical protein M513_13792 [Trichuris suis]|uniref:ADF-H domain-containing protein n=1 Tax=Trichuris suis TaxID=68888 RepID=A0A085LK35_9BILA|nr:hypothetical protein M513_13792 [Trichuris suis]